MRTSKKKLQKENPHLKITRAERIRNRKNLPTTVTVIKTEGREVPEQVTIY